MIKLTVSPNLEFWGNALVKAKAKLAEHKRLGDVTGDAYVALEKELEELGQRYRREWFIWLSRPDFERQQNF